MGTRRRRTRSGGSGHRDGGWLGRGAGWGGWAVLKLCGAAASAHLKQRVLFTGVPCRASAGPARAVAPAASLAPRPSGGQGCGARGRSGIRRPSPCARQPRGARRGCGGAVAVPCRQLPGCEEEDSGPPPSESATLLPSRQSACRLVGLRRHRVRSDRACRGRPLRDTAREPVRPAAPPWRSRPTRGEGGRFGGLASLGGSRGRPRAHAYCG